MKKQTLFGHMTEHIAKMAVAGAAIQDTSTDFVIAQTGHVDVGKVATK